MSRSNIVVRKSYTRKSHTRRLPRSRKHIRVSGSRVGKTTARLRTSGRSRGRKTKSAKFSKSKGYEPWIKREGKLGGPGFLNKSFLSQKRILNKCVKEYGYRSCLGSILVLMKTSQISEVNYKKLERIKNYLKEKHGGPGSYSN